MYQKMVNGLRGEVAVRCRSEAPERVLNLCTAHNIPFWDTVWEDGATLRFRTTLEGAQRLGEVAEGTAEVERLAVSGLPVLARRLRRRYVLVAAVVLALLWLWCGSGIILSFTVSGNETVSDTQILRALERCGVSVGTPGLSIRQESLRNRVLLELHDLSWLSLNVQGCTAHVQVVERQRPPQRYDPYAAANVVSSKAGLVTQVQALNGKSCVAAGDTVTAGQLLLSGVSDGRFGGVRYMHARGQVWGRTWYTLTTRVPLETVEQTGEGRERSRFSLLVGKKRINFFTGGSILGAGCDKITSYYPLRLPFGGELPLSLCRERITSYPLSAAPKTEEEALAEAKAALTRQLIDQLGEEGTVVDSRFTHRVEQGSLVVTLQAECHEQLGVETPIEVDK